MIIVKLVLVTFLASGGYVETSTTLSASFDQCVNKARVLAGENNVVYCVEENIHARK